MSVEDGGLAAGRAVFAVEPDSGAISGAREDVAALAGQLGLWSADGWLSRAEEADPLWRAMGEAAAASAQAGHAVLCPVLIAVGARFQAIDVLAIPEAGDRGASLAIVVRVRGGVVEALRGRFGLTQAEAEVAVALADGLGPTEIARARGAGQAVARSQLRRALAKAGLARQADLAALVARLASPPDA